MLERSWPRRLNSFPFFIYTHFLNTVSDKSAKEMCDVEVITVGRWVHGLVIEYVKNNDSKSHISHPHSFHKGENKGKLEGWS